jgi:peptide methionine sulfoxide reductase MsrB
MKCGAALPKFWTCPQCGEAKNPDSADKCIKCEVPRHTIREGAWDCVYCGRKLNRGSEKFCGGCGVPRGQDVQFYLPEDARLVTDEAELSRAKAGPDWKCEYCGGDNQSDKDICSGCGAPREGAPARKVIEFRDGMDKQGRKVEYTLIASKSGFIVEAMGQRFEGATSDEAFKKFFSHLRESEKKASEKGPEVSPGPAPQKPPEPKKSSLLLKGCGLGCAGLFILFILFSLFMAMPRKASGIVSGFHWEASVEQERLNTLTESKWEDEMPRDARFLSRSREIHHYDKVQTGTQTVTKTVTEKVKVGTKKVKVGTRDKGNGYFEDVYEDQPVYEEREKKVTVNEPVYKDVPVYKNKVTYNVDRWQVVETKKASGEDQNASLPQVETGAKARQGKVVEKYVVYFEGKRKKKLTYVAKSRDEWLAFKPGQSYKLKADLYGNVKQIE